MEDWEYKYDKCLTNPPEPPESLLKCEGNRCEREIYPDEKFYRIEGMVLCEECAFEWLESQAEYATREDCYGE